MHELTGLGPVRQWQEILMPSFTWRERASIPWFIVVCVRFLEIIQRVLEIHHSGS
jgi:hypothetical protein